MYVAATVLCIPRRGSSGDGDAGVKKREPWTISMTLILYTSLGEAIHRRCPARGFYPHYLRDNTHQGDNLTAYPWVGRALLACRVDMLIPETVKHV